ncbi:MAG: hypothetical protein ACREMB_00070, partial [Candidatus Rokuibacteriota bacterium]
MARVALVISLVALLIAVLAYKESGGSRALEEHVRSLQGAVEAARRETADALGRLERTLRTSDGSETTPGKPT